MGKCLVLLTILGLVLEVPAPAMAQNIQLFGGDETAADVAIVSTFAGVAVFGTVMTLYNRHNVNTGDPSAVSGSIGILSGVLSGALSAVFFATYADERDDAASLITLGSVYGALSIVTIYYSARNFGGGNDRAGADRNTTVSLAPMIRGLGTGNTVSGAVVTIGF